MLFLLLFNLTTCFAFHADYRFDNYEKAESAKDYLKFNIQTKKLGLFKSEVNGFVLEFSGNGKINGNNLSEGKVRFKVRSMTTDLYARDDQMWNRCLDYKNFDTIEISLTPLKFSLGELTKAHSSITIKGKQKILPISLVIDKINGKYVINGSAEWTFSDLEISNPGIGIATVSDTIHIKFSIEDQDR